MTDDRQSGNGEPEKTRMKPGGYIAIGIGVGVALGVAMGNIAVGVAMGVAIGAGMAAKERRKQIAEGENSSGDE